MKNILLLLSLLITLVGCEKYELETYPTLDGTYLVSFIRHDGVNTYEGYDENNTIYDGFVSTTIGDLNVGTEKVSFSGRTFYKGYQVTQGSDDWDESYYCEVIKGIDGQKGVFAIKVVSKEVPAELDNYSSFRNRLSSKIKSRSTQLFDALKEAADVEDNRANIY